MEETGLSEVFAQVQRHANELLSSDPSSATLSKEENRVLALQSVNRLNHKIGYLVRSSRVRDPSKIRLLQAYVNNFTKGLKSDNPQMMKSALASMKALIASVEKSLASNNGA